MMNIHAKPNELENEILKIYSSHKKQPGEPLELSNLLDAWPYYLEDSDLASGMASCIQKHFVELRDGHASDEIFLTPEGQQAYQIPTR